MDTKIEKSIVSQSEATGEYESRSAATGWRLLSFPTVLTVALTYLVFILSRRNIADPDLWWHLRNAERLLSTGHLPVRDAYSYTVLGTAVFPTEWLSELPYYFAYTRGGTFAIFLLVFVLTSVIVLGLFRLSYVASGDIKNSFMVSVGAAVLASVSIGARTLLFGWIFLICLLLVLEGFRKGRSDRLWLIPPVFCLWVNCHASWPMGMVIFAVFIASGLIEGRWGEVVAIRWSPQQLRKLLITAGVAVAAVFVNPLGYRLVLYPFEAMFDKRSGVYMSSEFASVDFHTSWGTVAIVLIIGTLLISVLSSEQWGIDEVGNTLLAFYYSLTYIRFLFLAGILLAPVFAKRVKLMKPYNERSDKQLHNAIALGILLCLFIVSVPGKSGFQNYVKYPDGAIAYMRSHGVQGRLFNEWAWGGYLIWNATEQKVFIDGRADPYGPSGVFRDYWSAAANDGAQAVLDKYRVDNVLMPAESVLAKSLQSNANWVVSYMDSTSILLRRQIATEAIR